MVVNAIPLCTMLAAVLTAPPVLDPVDSTVRRFRSVGVQLYGRDPCEGTELHCARLPVYTASDVDAVSVPRRGCRLGDFHAFSRLQNLRRITSQRTFTEQEYRVLNAAVPSTVWFSFKVRMDDGTLHRLGSQRSRNRDLMEDVNGDGVIDEWDGDDAGDADPVPPRVEPVPLVDTGKSPCPTP